MSVQSEITRISGNVSAALAAIAEKGVSVPDGSKSDALASLIASIEAGGGGGGAKSGSYTASERGSAFIEHGLGKLPMMWLIYIDDGHTAANGSNANMFYFGLRGYNVEGTSWRSRRWYIKLGSKGTKYGYIENESAASALDAYFDTDSYEDIVESYAVNSNMTLNKNYFHINFNATSDFAVGQTYHWVVM